jgi:hypothetical protein
MKTMKRIYRSINRGQAIACFLILSFTIFIHMLMIEDYQRGHWVNDNSLVIWSFCVGWLLVGTSAVFLIMTYHEARDNYRWLFAKQNQNCNGEDSFNSFRSAEPRAARVLLDPVITNIKQPDYLTQRRIQDRFIAIDGLIFQLSREPECTRMHKILLNKIKRLTWDWESILNSRHYDK